MPLADAFAIVERASAAAFTARIPLPIDEWCDRHRIVSPENAEPGPWRTDRTPYLREVMRACRDPRLTEVTIMMASQLGKTEAALNAMYQAVCDEPTPWLVIYPNDKLARRVLRKRIRPAVRATGPTAALFLPGRTESRTDELTFINGASIVGVGSGSSTNVRSTPIPDIYIDEFDLCHVENPSILSEARQRTGTFPRSKIIKSGTPGMSGEGLDLQYKLSDMRRYEVPCPHCGEFQELVWRGVRWEGGSTADPDEVERSAYYVCQDCAAVIHNHHKPKMLARGVWLREGQFARKGPDGAAQIVGEVPVTTHAGFRLSSLYSPFKTFGWVARDFVEARGFPDRVWFNGKLGEAWSPKGESLEVDALRKLCLPVVAGGYAMGTVPEGVLALTMGVDIQSDHCWAVVEGWTAGGVDVFLIWAERIESPPGSGLWQLDELRRRVFRTADGKGSLRISACFIDSQYRNEEVITYTQQRKREGVVIVQGHDTLSLPYRSVAIEKTAAGKPVIGGVSLVHVNNAHWTDAIWGQIQNSYRVVSGKSEDAPPDLSRPPGRRYLPHDTPDFVLDHLTSEAAIPRKRGGRTIVSWERKPGRRDNHCMDCLRYNAAGADWAGVKRLQASSGPAAAPKRIAGASGGSLDRPRDQWSSRP